MKKAYSILTILLTLIIWINISIAGSLKPYAFPFTGRWQPAEDPLLIDQYGYQDIQNMRRDGKRLRGVSGHTRVTNGKVNSVYDVILNGFHFRKSDPSESHVLVYAESSDGAESRIYQTTTAIPGVGDFAGDALLSNNWTEEPGRFSDAPQGNVIYCDDSGAYIWGGANLRIVAFIVSSADVTGYTATNAEDYSDVITNTSSDSANVARIDANDYFLVGSTRPLQGITVTISTPAAAGGTITAKEWNGAAWAALTLTDNTTGLTVSGTITWASTVDSSKPKYVEGYVLYWYKFTIDIGTAKISNVTADAEWQKIRNIWDGSEIPVASVLVFNNATGTYDDYTDEGQDDDTTSYVELNALATANEYVLLGFTQPVQAFNLRVAADEANTSASVLSVTYWTGGAWAAVAASYDGTTANAISISKTGLAVFEPPLMSTIFPRTVDDVQTFYYYKLNWDANLVGAATGPYYITGIPAQDEMRGYKFATTFQSRAFLCVEADGQRNKCDYSVYNAPDVWNGSDAGSLWFGEDQELTGAVELYNLYKTSGFNQLLVFKENETYRVFGDGPTNWEVQKMSGNIGMVAPLSVAVCELSKELQRHVAIWVSDAGVIMTDGAALILISEDIANYFDPRHDDYIEADYLKDSKGWFDPDLGAYKLLLNDSGTWIELEYSLKYNEWSKIYREDTDDGNPLMAGWLVHDTDGNSYSYGSTADGYIYRLENGFTWNGTAISEFVQTLDLMIDSEVNQSRHTQIQLFRLFMVDKDGTELSYLLTEAGDYVLLESGDRIITDVGEDITVEHFGRSSDTATVNGANGQTTVQVIDMSNGPYDTQDVLLGPELIHSFRFSADITTLADGMELLGFGLWYDPQTRIIDD